MAGFLDKISNADYTSNISGVLKKLSNLGMKYDDLIVKQSKAVGPTEANFAAQGPITDEMLYTLSLSDSGEKKYIAYYDKDYKNRREFLRKFAMNGEIEWIVDTITDEVIVYDNENFFAYPSQKLDNLLKDAVHKKVSEKIEENFKKIYSYFNFDSSILANQLFKQFLIDGFIAFEIIYDEKGQNIIGFKQLDPISLEPSVKSTPDGKKKVWIQYGDNDNLRRELLDSQVIYLSYAKGNYISRISYTERLVRPFNLLRVIEHTRIIWNLMNATFRLKIVVPIGSASRQRAQESLNELMAAFKEDIYLDFDSGELLVNGKSAIQFYRNYLIPSKNGEQPTIESVAGEGPLLNDTELINYFNKRLQIDSKIPLSRFNRDGSSNYSISAEGLDREEIRFSKFINRLRSLFQEILVKPLWIQTILDFPDFADDAIFKSKIGIKYYKDNIFEEMKTIELITKRLDFINNLKQYTKDGDSGPFFSSRFLVEEYLGMTKDLLDKNASYLEEDSVSHEEIAKDAGNTFSDFNSRKIQSITPLLQENLKIINKIIK